MNPKSDVLVIRGGRVIQYIGKTGTLTVMVDRCPDCKGKGKLNLRSKTLLQPCPYCNGTGKIKKG